MDVENTRKAVGLELPAAGTPPPGRAGTVKMGNIRFVGWYTPRPTYERKLGIGFTGPLFPLSIKTMKAWSLSGRQQLPLIV